VHVQVAGAPAAERRQPPRAQRDLLERLADSLDDRNLGSDEGMLAKLKRALAG